MGAGCLIPKVRQRSSSTCHLLPFILWCGFLPVYILAPGPPDSIPCSKVVAVSSLKGKGAASGSGTEPETDRNPGGDTSSSSTTHVEQAGRYGRGKARVWEGNDPKEYEDISVMKDWTCAASQRGR